jgi:hypothetical protein
VGVIRKLTLEANDVRLATRSNVREDADTRLARRLADAAEPTSGGIRICPTSRRSW